MAERASELVRYPDHSDQGTLLVRVALAGARGFKLPVDDASLFVQVVHWQVSVSSRRRSDARFYASRAARVLCQGGAVRGRGLSHSGRPLA